MPSLAAALVVGAVLGPWCIVESERVWVGVFGLLAVASIAGGRRGARFALVAAATCLGLALAPSVATGPTLAQDAVVQGVVESTDGLGVVVRGAAGRYRLSFDSDDPPVGTSISARTRPAASPVVLPGEPDPSGADLRAGIQARRVVASIQLGEGSATTPLPATFARWTHGGLLWALATGSRAHIDENTRQLLQRTGTGHLLAISGLHVGLLAGVVYTSLGFVARVMARWAPGVGGVVALRVLQASGAVVAASLYSELVGWPVSTRRAVWMVTGAALARLSGRRVDPWSLLALATCVVVAAQPAVVSTLGFGLSFGAVLGILAFTPRFSRLVPPDTSPLVRRAAEALSVSLGAMLGTLPLTAYWFQELSPWTPIANLIAGPLVGALGVPAAVLGMLLPDSLGLLVLCVGDAAVELAVTLLRPLDISPWTPAVGPVGATALVGVALLRRRGLLASCLALGVLVGRLDLRPDALDVTFLGVGQGDAVFVQFPDGRKWLVDGGPPSDRVLRWLRRQGHTALDLVALSHPDSDHLGGLEDVLAGVSVREVLVNRPPRLDERTYRRVWTQLFSRGVKLSTPDDVVLDGAMLLHPTHGWREDAGPDAQKRPKDNDDSLVLYFAHAGQGVLLTGDIERPAEAWLGDRLPVVDIVQAPHHGSRSSSTASLVQATQPDWVVISCGVENPFGHPHASTLAAWAGRRVVRTDRDGTVRFRLSRRGVEVARSDWLGSWSTLLRRPWRPKPPIGWGESPKQRRKKKQNLP